MSWAIPFSIFKLVLALADGELCSHANVRDQLWVLPTQALLFWRDGFNTVGGRKLKIVVILWLRWTTNAKIPEEDKKQDGFSWRCLTLWQYHNQEV